MVIKRIVVVCTVLIIGICLFAPFPQGSFLSPAVYAGEEQEGGGGGQLMCPMCNKPFPCDYLYVNPKNGARFTHVLENGKVVESGALPNFDNDTPPTIDTGGAAMGSGQGQSGSGSSGGDGFSGLDGSGGAGVDTLGDGDRAVPDLQTPEGGATGLWGRAANLVSAVLLDEEGSVKTWALAVGIIIIVLIALGIVAAATKRARRKRRKNARMAE